MTSKKTNKNPMHYKCDKDNRAIFIYNHYQTGRKITDLFFNTLELKEQTLYEIEVSFAPNNPPHKSFLFVGFDSGGYCEIYNNNMKYPIDMTDIYYMRVVKELAGVR